MIENVSRLIKHVEEVGGIKGLVVLDENNEIVDGRTYLSRLNGGRDIDEFKIAIKKSSTISDAIKFIQDRTGLKNIYFQDENGNKIHGSTLISSLK